MARHSELVKIPRIERSISKLALGTAPLGGLFTSVSESDAESTILTAINSGITYFDTAPLYGYGNAERRVGAALNKSGKSYVISTKVGRVLKKINPAELKTDDSLGSYVDIDPTLTPEFDFSREGIMRSIEDSLSRLSIAAIDIVYIHDADDRIGEAIEKSYPVLDELRAQGVIKGIGVGMNYTAPSIKAVKEMDLDIILIAGRFSLLDQSAQDELFVECVKKNTAVVIGGVYNSGILANPTPGATYDYEPAKQDLIDRALKIRDLLKPFNVPLTAAAIQFPLRHPAVTAVLTGSRNVGELQSNIADFDSEIPQAAWDALDASGLIQKVAK
jgi:D-threo-aldose 1-dehydrogenase